MKKNKSYKILALIGLLIFSLGLLESSAQERDKSSDNTLYTNVEGHGLEITFEFTAGEEYKDPTLAFWVEDLEGNFVQTLYVSKRLATGIFRHASSNSSRWSKIPGCSRCKATLPYYLHKRGIIAADSTYLPTPTDPIVDAYTGATPVEDFILVSKSNDRTEKKFRLLMEINQPWDWNDYWHSTKYPDNANYNKSCQPALVYAVTVDLNNRAKMMYYLSPIGHSHYAGEDGLLNTDLESITTALNIVQQVEITIR